MTDRIIALIDMDCFYCQVETREKPELKGKPMCVVQYKDYRGGGIIAVNYEARKFGVGRNMRGDEAKKKCEDVILVKVPEARGKADLTKYREAGKEVIQVLLQFGGTVERASIDEAYVDLTAVVLDKINHMKVTEKEIPNTYIVGHDDKAVWLNQAFDENDLQSDDIKLAVGAAIIEEMRAEVFNQTQFRCSAGIAHNKVLAKLTCGLHKPNKQTVLPQTQVKPYFQTIGIHKVRGLGGKLGEEIAEKLHCRTMGDLAQISILDLRRHFDEKTTTWLFHLARGVEHEEVKERDLPKSIGCSKMFRGPEILDTKAKMEYWMGQLCDEVAERLVKDQEDNERVAKSLTVMLSLENLGHVTRSGPLFSNDPIKIKAQALQLHATTNKCPSADPDWRPKVRYVSISASKFENEEKIQSINTFFTVSEKEVSKPKDDNQRQTEQPVISPEPEIDKVKCDKCDKEVSPFELPEHLDYHLALEVQAQFKQEQRNQIVQQREERLEQIPLPKSTGKRKNKTSVKTDKPEMKKQKTISSFFSKK